MSKNMQNLLAIKITFIYFLLSTSFFAVADETNTNSDKNSNFSNSPSFDFADVDLEKLLSTEVVSASKHAEDITMSPVSITVITSEQIKHSGSLSMAELFRRIPNTHISYLNPTWSTFSIRGGNFPDNDLMLPLLDWMELSLETYNIPFLEALPITIADIERIEIIRSPDSTLFGANAFNGVINILTKKPTKDFSIDAELLYGNYNSIYSHLQVMGKTKLFDYRVSAGTDVADSQSPFKEIGKNVKRVSGFIGSALNKDISVSLNAGYVESQGVYFIENYKLVLKEASQSFAKMDLKYKKLRIKSYINLFKTIDGYLNFNINDINDPDLNTIGPYNYDGDEIIGDNLIYLPNVKDTITTWDNELIYDIMDIPNSELSIGMQTRRTGISANYLVDKIPDEWRLGLYANYKYKFNNNIILSTGIRGEVNTVSKKSINPRISLLYTPKKNHTLRFSYIQAFKKPTIQKHSFKLKYKKSNNPTTDMIDLAYSKNPEQNPLNNQIDNLSKSTGNKNLQNQMLYGFETGYTAFFPNLKTKAVLEGYYYFTRNWISNSIWGITPPPAKCTEIIDWEEQNKCLDIFYGTYNNIEIPFDSYGLELTLFYNKNENTTYWFNINYRQVAYVNKKWPWSEKTANYYTVFSEYNNKRKKSSYHYFITEPYIPFWIFKAGIDHFSEKGLQFSLIGDYVSSFRTLNFQPGSPVLGYQQIDRIFIINSTISYKIKMYSLPLEFGMHAENIIDTNELEYDSGISRGIDSDVMGHDPYYYGSIPAEAITAYYGAEPHRRKILFFIRGEF